MPAARQLCSTSSEAAAAQTELCKTHLARAKTARQLFDLCAKMSQTAGNCCEKAIDLDSTVR